MANRFLNNIRINDSYAMPSADGSANQVITTDGAGNLSFIDVNSVVDTATGEVYYTVKNSTGSTLSKGKAVMAVGSDGNSGHILVDEMIADGSIESKYFLGILAEDIGNGNTGKAIHFGQIDQFNTNGQNGETWNDGQVLWCDPANNGDFTITEPDGPNVKIAAAIILNSSTNGKIQVRVQANEGIHDLHDTKITSQVDGDVLVWDNTTGVWFNDSTLNVDYTNSRVGIGTTSPGYPLEVVGKSASSDGFHKTGSQGVILSAGSGADTAVISNGWTSGVGDWMRLEVPSGDNESGLIQLNSNGNVGIGTTSPSVKLDVASNTKIDGYLKWGQPTGGSVQYMYRGDGGIFAKQSTTANSIHSGSNYFSIRNSADNIDLVYVSNTGNVGIGTNDPGQKLEVIGNAEISGRVDTSQVRIEGNQRLLVLTKTTNTDSHIVMKTSGYNDGFISSKNGYIAIGGVNGYSGNNLNININNGYVGIGAYNPKSKLEVKGNITLSNSLPGTFGMIKFNEGFSATTVAALEYLNEGNVFHIKSENPTGATSKIKFSVAKNGEPADEAMRIVGRGAVQGKPQVIIGNPNPTNSTRELYVDGEIEVTGSLNRFEGSLSVDGRVDADNYKLKGLNTAPATATSPGVLGEIRYTADYIYVCIQNNVWKRAALTSW